jgi:SAM-dependent methyltransferase
MERTVAGDVILQAELARALAPELCAPTGCSWYHGTWPTLRALGLVATPHRHAALFDGVLGAAAAAGRNDVLVCGAADAAMVEIVLAAYKRAGAHARVTVLDRCATPVQVAGEAAGRAGVVVEPWVADILHADRAGAFDVICTHGLLPLQPAEVRPRVIERWASLLRPGGVAVTTSSIAGPDVADPSMFDPEAVDAFADRARAAFDGAEGVIRDALPFGSADDVVAAAREWAARAVVHPVHDAAELTGAFEDAGFDVVLDVRVVEGSVTGAASGPWSARSTRYAELVATKR